MASPVAIEVWTTVPGTPQDVWHLITDWENQGDWMLEARDFRVISEQREGVGVRAEATISLGGISTTDRVSVTGWEPEHRLAIRHEGWVAGSGEINLTPLDAGQTHVFWREELYPPWGLIGALGLLLFRPLLKHAFKRDLRILQGLVRARSGALRQV